MSEEVAAILMEGSHGDDSPDVLHKKPRDRSEVYVWFFEDPTNDGNVLTQDGIYKIAHHKYKGGEYTHLDDFLNPYWTYCTENFLPMSMAPNMVTTIGGLFCFLSYMATWYYLPQYELRDDLDQTPSFLLLFNGIAIAMYYTLDCMDGKQARRTGTSTPLGQLFDHGVDCFSNLTHLSTCQSFLLMGPCRGYLWSQIALQVVFFATQWEEYFTGTLTHAYGKVFGVTEVNYGLALATMANVLVDVNALYNKTVQELLYNVIPISILPNNPKSPSLFVTVLNSILTLRLKYFICAAWVTLCISLTLSCMYRVAKHIGNFRKTIMAYTKLFSPILMGVVVLKVIPLEVIQQECRSISLSTALCYCFITIKMIVFSMARMTFATFQLDILPLLVVAGFVTWEYGYASYRRLKPAGLAFLYQLLTLYYLLRLLLWARVATQQLCQRLNVWLFTIKPKEQQKSD